MRFGKFKIFKSKNNIVNIIVNGKDTGITMRLGKSGEAYFLVPKEEVKTKSQKREAIEELKRDLKDSMAKEAD